MKIAVYSGSFNPLHIGHLAILRRLGECGCFDGVYLIVSPKNPLKDIDESGSAQRLEAAEEAVARHHELKVKVDDIEFTLPSPQYTIRTLDELKKREPDNDFSLVVGGDQIADFRRWRDYKRILIDYGVAVFPREGFDTAKIREDLLQENPLYRITLIEMPLVNISSTELRQAAANGKDISKYLM
ncbi:MAG: nicotinate (nicotinamide) nucleotide adenylyltransferase [Candidatus Cryptobacteroides sp.]